MVACRYCGEPWVEGNKNHRPDCFIVTGIFRVLGRKKRPAPEPVKPLDLGDE